MEQKKKSFFFRKALILLLSLIILFNGLGLVIAGRKVGKKKWVTAGWAYIVIEWICTLTGVGVGLAAILYFVSIIHTALICSEYGHLLNSQYSKKSIEFDEININDSIEFEIQGMKVNCGNANDEPNSGVKIDRIPLNIGTAEVTGKSRNNLKIKVHSETGKVFEFDTAGNVIKSFNVNGKTYNYGG